MSKSVIGFSQNWIICLFSLKITIMAKLGTTEILIIIGIPVLLFLFIFWVGKLAGRNAANKEFLNRNKNNQD